MIHIIYFNGSEATRLQRSAVQRESLTRVSAYARELSDQKGHGCTAHSKSQHKEKKCRSPNVQSLVKAKERILIFKSSLAVHSALPQAIIVAPVVITSSMSSRCLPSSKCLLIGQKASATFCCRSEWRRCVWLVVKLRRATALLSIGKPTILAMPLAISLLWL